MHQVERLDVAMHYASAVQGGQGRSHVLSDVPHHLPLHLAGRGRHVLVRQDVLEVAVAGRHHQAQLRGAKSGKQEGEVISFRKYYQSPQKYFIVSTDVTVSSMSRYDLPSIISVESPSPLDTMCAHDAHHVMPGVGLGKVF